MVMARCGHDTGGVDVLDVVFVLVSVVFFIVSLGYVAGCDRLK